MVSVLRVLVVAVPAAWVGGKLFGVPGIFAGSCGANLAVGLISYLWTSRTLRGAEARTIPVGGGKPLTVSAASVARPE